MLSALDVLKHTDKSNCGRCGLPNCMAFSALAARGLKDPADCPFLAPEVADEIRKAAFAGVKREEENPAESVFKKLVEKMPGVDLAAAADRLGGKMVDGRLRLHCLGKIFDVDQRGGLHTECHVNQWVHVSILQYLVQGAGKDPTGDWITFREIKGQRDWEPFFAHRCERTLYDLACREPDLLLDILELFGREVDSPGPVAEHCILLYPLPKVPFLFCLTPADGDFETKFTLFFDRSIEVNLKAEGTYLLAQGIVEMVKRLAATHGENKVVERYPRRSAY